MSDNSLYKLYNARRLEIAELTDTKLAVVRGLDLDRFFPPGFKPGGQLSELSNRLRVENLRVLVMGEFSSGKSTFVNAMLGASILPDSALPTTAVITEIRYAEEAEKKIVLHPKPGKWPDGDAPFTIGLDEFKKYTSIQHKGGASPSSPFSLAEVFWPLDICREKVELVDSPGLNDPDNHDEITLTYASSADAIIYCMSCERAYTKLDSVTINTLRNQGYTSLLFVLTKFDRIQESAMLKDNNEDEEFRQVMIEKLRDKTDLGEQGIFFVDSLHALMARKQKKLQLLEATSIPALERRIESYVVEHRGKSKLLKAVYSIRGINTQAAQSLEERLAMSTTSLQTLERKYEEAKIPLQQLAQRGELICSQLDSGLKDTLREMIDASRLFLMGCPDKIPMWLKDYEPEAQITLNPFKTKDSIGAVVQDYLNQVKLCMTEEGSVWSNETLVPMVSESVAAVFRKLDRQATEHSAALSKIRMELVLDGVTDRELILKQTAPSDGSRIGAAVVGFFTNPLAFSVGSALGWQGLVRSLVVQIVALTVVSFFSTGGIAVLIGLVVGALGGAGWSLAALSEAIRKKVISSTQEELRKSQNQAEIMRGITTKAEEALSEISAKVRASLEGDLARLKGEVEAGIAEKKKDASAIQKERERLQGLRKQNMTVTEKILNVAIAAGVPAAASR